LLFQAIHRCSGLFLLALSSASCLPAQDGQTIPAPQNLADGGSIAHDTLYTPLTLAEKYKFSLNKVFGPSAMLAAGLHAGLDQAGVGPHDWGRGSDAFGVRLASRFGRSLVRQNVAFGVRALDHEDPRYFVSGQGGPLKRTWYAMVHTFVVHNDNGSMMPAYSRFVADYGMPFIAQQWRPGRFRTVPEGLGAGTCALGLGVGMNIGREFWPDLRKKLLATHLGRRYATMAGRHGQTGITGAAGRE
jgi:hypothetical protein